MAEISELKLDNNCEALISSNIKTWMKNLSWIVPLAYALPPNKASKNEDLTGIFSRKPIKLIVKGKNLKVCTLGQSYVVEPKDGALIKRSSACSASELKMGNRLITINKLTIKIEENRIKTSRL